MIHPYYLKYLFDMSKCFGFDLSLLALSGSLQCEALCLWNPILQLCQILKYTVFRYCLSSPFLPLLLANRWKIDLSSVFLCLSFYVLFLYPFFVCILVKSLVKVPAHELIHQWYSFKWCLSYC